MDQTAKARTGNRENRWKMLGNTRWEWLQKRGLDKEEPAMATKNQKLEK